VIRSPLTAVEKQVFDKTKKAIYRPELASCEAKQTSLKSILVSTMPRTSTRMLRTKLKQPLRLSRLWRPLQPHTRLKVLWSQLLMKLVEFLATRQFQLCSELSLASPRS